MLTYQTFATIGCEPEEFRFLCRALALVPENMARGHFEGSATGAGFEIEQVDPIGSEWRENAMENDDPEIMTDLLSVARMRRRRDELIERFGRESRALGSLGYAQAAAVLAGEMTRQEAAAAAQSSTSRP